MYPAPGLRDVVTCDCQSRYPRYGCWRVRWRARFEREEVGGATPQSPNATSIRT